MTKRLLMASAFVVGLAMVAPAQDLNTLLVSWITQLRAGTVDVGAAGDALLVRDAANVLAIRNSTAAQALNIYNTFTSASAYERAVLGWSANLFSIETGSAGAGTTRAMRIGTNGGGAAITFRTNNTNQWTISGSSGALLAATDNTPDIGADGATRPNDIFLAGRLAVNNHPTVTVDGATTFAVTSSYTILACTGAETINTITGGVTGMILVLENTDTDCTIADDDAATATDAVNLSGAATTDVGAAEKVITLIYNGASWFQIAESDN